MCHEIFDLLFFSWFESIWNFDSHFFVCSKPCFPNYSGNNTIQYYTLSIHRLSFFIINVQYYLGKPCLPPRIPCENTVWLHPAGIEPRTIPCSPCLCIPTVWIIVEIFFFPGFQFSMYIVPTIHRIRSISETSSDYKPDPVPIGNQFRLYTRSGPYRKPVLTINRIRSLSETSSDYKPVPVHIRNQFWL